MARDTVDQVHQFPDETTVAQLVAALGEFPEQFQLVVDADGLKAVELPDGFSADRFLIVDNDLFLIDPDGRVVVLLAGAENNFVILADGFPVSAINVRNAIETLGDYDTLGDAPRLTLGQLLDLGTARPGTGEQEPVRVGDPLEGLEYNPLLPPTDYPPELQQQQEFFAGEVFDDAGAPGPGNNSITLSGPPVANETDAPLDFRPASFLQFNLDQADLGEAVTQVTLTIDGLPLGTTSNFGQITAAGGVASLSFTGSESEFNALTLTFPTDFSTESRNDAPPGPLQASVSFETNYQGSAQLDFDIDVFAEGDAIIDDTLPDTVPDETDDPITFRPSELLEPQVTDIDGSEGYETLELVVTGLPGGSTLASLGLVVPVGAVASVATAVDGSVTLTVSMDAAQVADIQTAYESLEITVPADFSTDNRSDLTSGTQLPISLTLNVQTDEDVSAADDLPNDGTVTVTRVVDIGFEEDIDLTAPDRIEVEEDGGVPDSSVGVDVDMGIEITIDDIDGSETEDPTDLVFRGLVTVEFGTLPPGTSVNGGTLTGATWTGTVPEAEALILSLPGDYSGEIDGTITVTTREGSETVDQLIVVTPTSDVEIVGDILTQETDAPLRVVLSDFIEIRISDPNETLAQFQFTLDGVPVGTRILDEDGNVIGTSGPGAGGTINLSLSYDVDTSPYDPAGVTLEFPTDYSTENPPTTLQADLTVVTRQNGVLTAPVSETIDVVIEAEGDVFIDDTMPDTVPDETDSPTLITPSDLLMPVVTDQDGSESLETLTLTIDGLPAGSTLASLLITVPAGATATLVDEPTTGAATLTLSITSAATADILAAYDAFELTLPRDFSTANRADLTNGDTALPLTFQLDVQTDEDQDPTTDTPVDGTATATRVVEIDFEPDIELTAPILIEAQEDGGIPDSSAGVTVDLEIEIEVLDIDRSETETPGSFFSADVEILFTGIPTGTVFSAGTYDDATGVWTGSVAEAEALQLDLPGDYNGTILNVITVTTPEGQSAVPQVILVEPVTDVVIDGEVIVDETDAPVEVLLSAFIDVQVPAGETIESLTFDLDGLPAGTLAVDGSGNPVGAFSTNPDGTVDFLFEFTGTGTDPRDVRLVFPTDYSTENPMVDLSATLNVVTNEGPSTGTIPVTVNFEGDVVVDDATVALAETDSVVLITPSDFILPRATDLDMSESIDQVAVVFNTLPPGTRVSTDGGASFGPATATLNFVGDLAAYENLVIELPADFSTENPASVLEAQIVATTDENGVDDGFLTITLDAEGDLDLSGPGVIAIAENDAPGDTDEDTTSQAPLDVRLADAVTGQATDADGSETIASVDLVVNGLPAGTQYSTNGGVTFQAVPAGPVFNLTLSSLADYENVIIRLPDDFSTTTPITGSATFTTDEALLAGETDTGPDDGIETGVFSITVSSEQDVEITSQDITVIEDLGTPIPLNLDVDITDIDGSESTTSITLDFANLPAGDTILSDGTVLNAANTQWTGTQAEVRALAVASLPTHYSGVIDITITVDTDEGDPTVATESFQLNVTPVAEPTIDLSVDDSTPNVDERGPDNFIVDEDTTFLLLIDAETPDRDGSEALTEIVIENIPAGWVPDTGGAVDLALFEQGAAQITSATLAGTTLTITLAPGVTDFDGALRMAPLPNDDRDVATIVGDELTATVTSVDQAATLPTDTQTATDSVDVDVDAIVDDLNTTPADTTVNENRNNVRRIDVDLTGTALDDTDGSETITSLELTISVATASDVFDPSDPNQLGLRVSDSALRGFATITQTGSTADSVTYSIEPTPGTTNAEFSSALESLQTTVPQHFSGILTLDGTLAWNETTTGDVEDDLSDNFNTGVFQITQTVNPRAEADLTASVFVLTATEVAAGSPTAVSASVEDGSVSGAEILTLLESTGDGSGPGQVELFVGLDASTPDLDGSEELSTLVVENVPSDWIADFLSGTAVQPSAFFTSDGTAPLTQAELDKIQSATYDAATGELTITFVPDVTSFEASIQLRPSLYEDYDVDRDNGDPFTSVGDFFGDDLTITLTTQDNNTATTDDQVSDATFDVDVDPVNNFAVILTLPEGNEGVIDAAGGVWQIPFEPIIQDQDGSEQVTAVVLREVPDGIQIFVPDPANPGGPKIPALLTEVNTPPGFNTWSLENGGWLEAEARGIPLHFAGTVAVNVEVVTTEADGGTRVTTLPEQLTIDPVVDGGDPSESYETREDRAVFFPIDGNLIDNPTNSPESPEAILDIVIISNIIPDSGGRVPQFFDGPPSDPSSVELTPLFIRGVGSLNLTVAQASNLWVLPGQDSNEDFVFDVSLEYFETIDPTQTLVATGTATLTVTGVADDPVITVQDETGYPFDPSTIDGSFRPGDVVDGIPNSDRIFGYAGFDDGPFLLDKRLRTLSIETGLFSPVEDVTFSGAVTPLTGVMTEILVPEGDPAADFDGSETIYYIITGVDPATAFTNATPLDTTGTSYLVTETQLPNLEFVPVDVAEPTYYDLTFNAIVVENDANLPDLSGLSPEAAIAAINAVPGGAVVSEDFTIVVVPDPDGGGGDDCEPEQELPLPVLELVGSGDEDTEIAFKLRITPNPPFYDSIDDLANLPNGVVGDFGLGIDLPPGATLSSDPPGAVLFDPVTGLYAIDIDALGVDPADPTQTAGSILFTPPEHESSPINPFPTDETFGPDDPYDNLNQLEYEMLLNNFTCGTSDSATSTFNIVINPVVDGPEIVTTGGSSVLEDTPFSPDIEIRGIDPGERPTGDIVIEIDGANGGQLLDGSGNPIAGTPVAGGFIAYTVSPADLASVQITANEHYSGPLEYRITATSEDIDGSTRSSTVTRTLDIIPVADVPVFDFDETVVDPDTGQPFVDESGPVPVITIVEDIPFTLGDVIDANSPDQDGSEEVTIVLENVPDYLLVTGPATGFIDNGDGTFTMTPAAFEQIQIVLRDEHARTPDALDPTLPAQIPLTLTVNTLELANSDSASGSADFLVVVRPDADVPTVNAIVIPATGQEDDGTTYLLSISGTTPDPHEDMEFQITVPPGGRIFLDGVEQVPVGGVVTLPSGAGASIPGSTSFQPDGTVTFEPPADFAGDITLDIVSVTTDTAVGGGFSDSETSPPAQIDLTITPAPDLVVTVNDPDVVLTETDDVVSYSPAPDFDITVTDTDGSEIVDSVTYTIVGVPAGTTYQIGAAAPVAVTGDLIFAGTLADFNQLQVNFPADFATNGTPLDGSLRVTTNEGGNETGTFTIEIDGELDLTVTIDPMPLSAPQTGTPIQVDFGIDAMVTDSQATPSETLEEVTVQFSAPLPAGTTVSAGTLSTDRQTLTLTRGATSPADFALLVAALSITLPGTFAGTVEGAVSVSTNHGAAPDEAFSIAINDQPDVSGPVSVTSTDPVLFIDFAALLANATDADQPLSVANVATSDPDVTIDVQATGVQITVPDAYVGTPVLTYDVVDSGPGPASTSTQANLDIDTLQMESTGTPVTDPGGGTYDLLDDVTGAVGGNDIARGTSGNDGVVLSLTSPYAEIEGFDLLGGDDFIDLSAGADGYSINLGSGDDWAIGSTGDDTITGGDGADTLQGGGGSDIFVMTDLTMSDVITDYEGPAGGDQIDLTALVSVDPADLATEVSFNAGSGALEVSGSQVATVNVTGGGVPPQVEVIFNDASGAQQTAVI
ncbi:MAG: cadherin-like domain-containing protein [Ruegeria sp.]